MLRKILLFPRSGGGGLIYDCFEGEKRHFIASSYYYYCYSLSSRRGYVSKHYKVEPGELRRVLNSMNTEYRPSANGEDIEVKVCVCVFLTL